MQSNKKKIVILNNNLKLLLHTFHNYGKHCRKLKNVLHRNQSTNRENCLPETLIDRQHRSWDTF